MEFSYQGIYFQNFENRKQSLNKDSNPNVSKTDDPEESDKTTKGKTLKRVYLILVKPSLSLI